MSMHYVECAVKSVGKLPDFSKKAENDPFEYFETAGAEEYKKAGKKEEVFEGALSTIESDRIGDVMLAKGCHFDDFIDNPVIQLMHSPFIPAIGKVLTIGVSDDQFKIWWIFDEGDDLGAKIKHKYSEKFMRSLSIGFRGKFVEVPEGAKSIEVNIPKLGKNHKVTIDFKGWKNKPRRVYNDWELHEGSACNIGMNARALV